MSIFYLGGEKMAQKTITAKLDIQAQISQYQSSLDNFQKELSKLHLSSSLKDGFSNLLTDYKKELEKLSSASSSGKLSIINEKEIAKSFDKLEGLYDNLIKKMNSTGYKSSVLEKDYKAIKAMGEAEKAYKKELSGAQKELDRRQKAYDDINERMRLQKARAQEFQNVAKAAAKTEAEKAEVVAKATKELEAQKKAAEDAAKAVEKSKEGYKNRAGGDGTLRGWNLSKDAKKVLGEETEAQRQLQIATENVAKAQQDQRAATEASASASKDATNAVKTLTTQEIKYKADIDNATKALNDQQEAVNKLSEDALVKLKQSLQSSKVDWKSYGIDSEAIKSYDDLEAAIKKLQNAGQENVAQEMRNMAEAVKQMEGAGKVARQGFDEASDALVKLSEKSKDLDQLKNRIAYFFGLTNAVNLFKRAIRSAFNTIKDLDKVMTETAVVTQFDVSDMWDQLPEYTKRANELGVSIHSAYESATIYYQQGLKTNEVIALSNQTLKMARIAGLDAADATDRMTNALRGFNMELNETNAERVADVYSKLAAISASNVDEISTAMTKVASLASNANMQFETTAAFLSQIIETTRESAETAGTALKTVVARFSEVKKLYSEGELLGTDEEGEAIDVNKVSAALRSAGINLNEYLTGMKGLDDIFLELASKWDSLDQVQQRYIATMAAGSRQQSRFIAMMQDYGRTQELVNAANNAAGASNEQYQKTLDSLESKLAKLKNAWDEFLMGITNNTLIKAAVDGLTGLINVINGIISSISRVTGPLQSFTKSLLSLVTVWGGLKIGKSIFNNMFAKLGSTFMGKGKEAGTSFISGFSSATTKIKQVFTKNFWVGIQPPKKIDTSAFDVARARLDALKVAKEQNIVTDATLIKAEELYASELANVASAYGLNTEQIAVLNLATEFGVETDLAAAAAKKGLATATINEYIQTLIAAGATEEEARAKTKEMISTYGKIAAEETEEKTTQKGVLTRLASIVSTKASAIANKAETGTIWQKVAAKIAEKTAIESAAAAELVALGIIGLIIAAIGLLIFALVKLAQSIETPTEKLNNLKKEADSAKESADKTKEAYTNLVSDIDKYESLNQELDELTIRTDAWYEKLKEVNQQVSNLLETFPELAKYLKVDENGKLTFDEAGLESVVQKRGQQTNAAQAIADISSALTDLYTGIIDKQREEFYSGTGSRFRNAGTATFWNPNTRSQSSIFNEDIINAIKLYNERPDLFKKSNYTEADLGVLEQYNLKDYELSTFANFFGKNVNFSDEYLKSIYSKLQGFDIQQSSSQKQAQGYITAAIDSLSSEFKDSIDEYYNDILIGISKNTSSTLEEQVNSFVEGLNTAGGLQDLYEERFGYKTSKSSEEALQDIYLDIFGGQLEDIEDLGEDVLRKRIAEYKITQKESDRIKKIYEQGISQQIAALLNPETALNYTEDELNKIEWNSKLILEKAGYEPDEVAQIVQNYEDTKNAIINQLNEDFNNLGFNSKNKNTWYNQGTINTRLNTTKQLNTMKELGGQEGLDTFSLIMNEAYHKLSSEDFNKFVNEINAIDFKNINSIKGLSDALESVGIDASSFTNGIEGVESELISAARAAKEFSMEKVKEQLKTTMDLAEETRGRSSYRFSDEDIQKYIAQGIDISNFEFNGQDWVYIGGTMETLAAAVEANTSAVLEENKIQLQRQVESGNQLGKLADQSSLSDVGREHFLSGEFSAAGFRNLLTGQGIKSITDSTTGESYDVSTISSELLKIIYQQMVSDYQNLDFNTAKLESYDSDLGQNADWSPNTGEAIKAGEQAGLNGTQLVEYANQLQEVINNSNELKDISHDMATEIAKDNLIMVNSIKELNDNWETWQKGLESKEGSTEYVNAITGLQKTMKGLLGITEDLPAEFLKNEKTMDLLARAANDDREAIEELRAAAAKEIIANVKFDEEGALEQVNNLIDLMAQEDLTLEAGATLDTSSYANSLYDILEASGATIDDIQGAFNSLGWEPNITYKEMPLSEAGQYYGTTEQEILVPNGTDENGVTQYKKMTVQAAQASGVGGETTVRIPMIGDSPVKTFKEAMFNGTTFRGSGRSVSPPPTTTSSSGGGGGGSSEKSSYWENPYDELYNLTEKINEAMRTREALEREYGKLLDERTTSTRQILKNSLDEIALLRQQLDYEKQMEAGRRRQVENIGSQMYTDDEGNRTAFSELGVMKYASYDFKTGLIQIDWSGLEEIANDASREEEGKQAEAYISKLEELVGQYEDVRDAVWEIEDKLEEIRERSIDESIEFQQRLYDAIVSQKQAIIDSFDAMSQTIEETTSKVIDNVREQIESARQQRQNEETEQEISDKEARLAYLSRDTSGANQLETMKLQKEIDDARQNYSDSLVDQAIDQMQKDADLAAEQRAQQLQIMQAQLDIATENGEFWKDVDELLNSSFNKDGTLKNNAPLVNLLKETEAFRGMSAMGQDQWIDSMVQAWLTANEGISNYNMKKAEEAGSMTLANGTKLSYKNGKWVDAKGNTYSDVTYDPTTGNFTGKNNNDAKPVQAGNGKASTSSSQPAAQEPKTRSTSEISSRLKAMYNLANSGQVGGQPQRHQQWMAKGYTNDEALAAQEVIEYVYGYGYSLDNAISKVMNKYGDRLKKYASGGLADYTGLAWLDGSKSKPESILSAEDTKNFIALRDILAQFMGSGAVGGGGKNGDNYFDIDIQAEIGSDYDVDRLASQIKQQIYNDSTYRNVNAISYIR